MMIRPAQQPDVHELKSLAKTLYGSFNPHQIHAEKTDLPDFTAALASNRLFVARANALRGFMIAYPDQGIFFIDCIDVSTQTLRDTTARQFMVFAESTALEAECDILALRSGRNMDECINYYKRQGFKEVARMIEAKGQERVYLEM